MVGDGHRWCCFCGRVITKHQEMVETRFGAAHSACTEKRTHCVQNTRAYASRSRSRRTLGVHPHPYRHRGLSCFQEIPCARREPLEASRIIRTGLPFITGLYFSREGSTFINGGSTSIEGVLYETPSPPCYSLAYRSARHYHPYADE